MNNHISFEVETLPKFPIYALYYNCSRASYPQCVYHMHPLVYKMTISVEEY